MEFSGRDGIEREIELVLPREFKPRFGEAVVPILNWIQPPRIYSTFAFIKLAEMAGLCRDHTPDITRTVRAFCIADTSSEAPLVLNCWHEHNRDSEAGQA